MFRGYATIRLGLFVESIIGNLHVVILWLMPELFLSFMLMYYFSVMIMIIVTTMALQRG